MYTGLPGWRQKSIQIYLIILSHIVVKIMFPWRRWWWVMKEKTFQITNILTSCGFLMHIFHICFNLDWNSKPPTESVSPFKNKYYEMMHCNRHRLWKIPIWIAGRLYHAVEHVAHLCRKFASSSCGLKGKNMNHCPPGILYFLKSLIMWGIFKGTGFGLVCINQCFDTYRIYFQARLLLFTLGAAVSVSTGTRGEILLAFHSICLEDLIKQEENSSWYFGLALAEEVSEQTTHTLAKYPGASLHWLHTY